MSSINWVDELSGTVSDVHLIVPLAAIKPFHAHTLSQAIDISRSVLKQIIEALEVRKLSLAISPSLSSLKVRLGSFTTYWQCVTVAAHQCYQICAFNSLLLCKQCLHSRERLVMTKQGVHPSGRRSEEHTSELQSRG